jgi:methanethiol oxidase
MTDESHHHDPTFYRSPRDAAAGPPENLAYVAAFSKPADQPDAIAVVDTDPASASYASVVGFTELPNLGDELHHFGWNACSSALCPTGSHTHGDRRYLVVPGIRSSRIYILDTQPDPASPQVVKVLGPEELGKRASYSRPHTVHCGPGYLYVSCLGGGNGNDGPGGVALLDHSSFEVLGQFEADRGDQYLAYDLWWHINDDVLVTSEWGTPSMIENGIVPELLLGRKYGHRLHFWDMNSRRHVQTVDLGDEHQMALELRPAHDPAKKYGFVGVVISVEDLSASIWLWHERDGKWAADKVISIPAEPAPAEQLPPALQPFGAVPPLVSDLALSVDDRHLYVSCWGTGELKQYDVSDPSHPRETGSVRIGGIVGRTPHPAPGPAGPAAGRRPADGRGQPGQQAGVLHQLAVRRLGRAVLPRRCRRLDDQTRRRPPRRYRLR